MPGNRVLAALALCASALTGYSALALDSLLSDSMAYASYVDLQPDLVARIGGTGLTAVTKYPVAVDYVRLLNQGSVESDLIDALEIQVRLLDAAYTGLHRVYIILVLVDQAGNVTFSAAGSIDVNLSTTPVVIRALLPQPVPQEAVAYVIVQASRV